MNTGDMRLDAARRVGSSMLSGRSFLSGSLPWSTRVPLQVPTSSLQPHGHHPLDRQRCPQRPSFTTSASPRNGAAAPEPPIANRIIETELVAEAEKSYLSYAMSVIVGRALPDVRDGLKPVHRRILFAMHELGMTQGKPFRKCARVVGEVLGKFHPHGDTAVYDALVRMSQPFAMQSPLVDGHGNFGSLDDDPPAAMRYTECRLQAYTGAALLADLEAETVDFVPNFDGSVPEPTVLPARLPNLLVNGSSGIAVGIATKIPSHNMREVVAGLRALARNPRISTAALMRHIPAPDFPTGGEILLSPAMADTYAMGRGTFTVRAKLRIEDAAKAPTAGRRAGARHAGSGRAAVVLEELPYQTNKAALVEQIARLVDAGTLIGVSDVRDESDRDGMRVVVEVKRGFEPVLVVNQLYKHTAVQGRFSCNMVALVGSMPRTLGLRAFLQEWLDFRATVVAARARAALGRARRRLHLVDGFLLALRDIEGVVRSVRDAADGPAAAAALVARHGLSREQADGVLGLALRRLTSLESGNLEEEAASLRARVAELEALLASQDKVLDVVVAEAEEIAEKFGRPRRTALVSEDPGSSGDLQTEDVTPNAPSLIVYSRRGYIKRMRTDAFSVQRLRGRGKRTTGLRDDDSVEDVVAVNDHDRLLLFTAAGKMHALRAYEVPEASRTSGGTAIKSLFPRIGVLAAVLPLPGEPVAVPGGNSSSAEDADADPPPPNDDVVLLTSKGLAKRVPLARFGRMSRHGKLAMGLTEGDSVRFVCTAGDTDSILLAASTGYVIHFRTSLLRPSSRGAGGVKTMLLRGDAHLVGMGVLPCGVAAEEETEANGPEEEAEASSGEEEYEGEDDEEGPAAAAEETPGPWLLLLTRRGLGKRVALADFRLQGRVGRGLKAIKLNPGDALAAAVVVGGEGGGAVAIDRDGSVDGAEAESGDCTDVLVSTENGLSVRLALGDIRVLGRAGTKGHRVLKVQPGDAVASATLVGRG
uniref:DNA topoisomerase (ATP-hydrolyzing) n=1 Tax=Auxenochlorella protothecoides TaxID=3075 RepID=A0A1D2AGK7_AUXPR